MVAEAQAFNPVQGQPGLWSEVQDSQSCNTETHLKK